MSTTQPAKQWSITATVDAAGLSFARGAAPLEPLGGAEPQPSPVEYLLLAAAGCMALSLKAAALARQRPFSSAQVVASGAKAAQSPSRLESIDLRVDFGTALSAPEAEQILLDAKRLCTVTNTIGAAPSITVTLKNELAR